MDQSTSRVVSPSRAQGFSSDSIKRNAFIFGITMLLLQVGLSLIYGFLIKVPAVQMNTSSIIEAIGLAILVVGGFGLLFGYSRRLAWSGIGFTFFITAFCIEVYPLVNSFWTRTAIQSNNSPTLDFAYGNRDYNIFLSDRETSPNSGRTFYGNSLTNAIKCALSVAVAFSAVLGRVGHLECLIVAVFGTVGFELNRQIIQQNQGIDTFGTFYIFTFGGFMGLALGVLQYLREQRDLNKLDRKSMRKYTGSEHTVLFALFGALIIFALFPLLAHQIDAYSRYNRNSTEMNPVSIVAALGAGGISAILTTLFINGQIIVRDAIHGPVAGAIACGASSLYITNPVYAFVAGSVGGITQTLIQNFIERRASNQKKIVSTVSWSLFGIQGIIGAAFAAGWQAITYSTIYHQVVIQPATMQFSSQFQFYGGLISAGIGAAFGLGAGLLMILVNGQRSREYFEDYYYWFNCDSIRYDIEEQPIPVPISAKPEPKPPSVIRPVPQIPVERSEDEFDFSLGNDTLGNPYAYL